MKSVHAFFGKTQLQEIPRFILILLNEYFFSENIDDDNGIDFQKNFILELQDKCHKSQLDVNDILKLKIGTA